MKSQAKFLMSADTARAPSPRSMEYRSLEIFFLQPVICASHRSSSSSLFEVLGQPEPPTTRHFCQTPSGEGCLWRVPVTGSKRNHANMGRSSMSHRGIDAWRSTGAPSGGASPRALHPAPVRSKARAFSRRI